MGPEAPDPLDLVWEALEEGDGERALNIIRALRVTEENPPAALVIGAETLIR